PEGVVQGNVFHFGYRRHALRDEPLHVGNRQQGAGKRKAVVGELGHHALPTASARTRASMVSSFSAFARISSTTPSMSSISTTGRPALGNGVSETMPATWRFSGWKGSLPTSLRYTSMRVWCADLKPSISTRSTGDIFCSRSYIEGSDSSRSSC